MGYELTPAFKIGQILVEPNKGTLTNEGQTQPIEPKAMAVLCLLHEHHNEVVSQQMLFDTVWPNRVFSPSSLQRIIAILRKALGETSQNPQFLFTHPKLGYRLQGVTKIDIKENETVETTSTELNEQKTIPPFIIYGAIVILLGLLLATLVIINPIQKQAPLSYTQKQLSFTKDAEFNAQISPNGNVFSYIKQTNRNSLIVNNLDGQGNELSINSSNEIIEHIWLTQNQVLLVTENASGDIELSEVKIDLSAIDGKIAPIMTLDKWRHAGALASHKGAVYLVAENDAYHLLKISLATQTVTSITELSERIINVSLASSPHGLYLHYFDGQQSYFKLMENEHKLETIAVQLPDITNLSWSPKHKGLVVNNQMIAEQLLYKDSHLSTVTFSSPQLLSHIAINDSKIIADTATRDMDIIALHNSQITPVIDSKFSDYQSALNAKQQLAFLSTRNGFPQIFLKTTHGTRLIYDNPNKVGFIPPLIWSPEGEKLAFVVDGSIIIFDVATQNTTQLPNISAVQRIYSWSEHNTLLYKLRDGQSKELDLITHEMHDLDVKNAFFLARDSNKVLLGVTESALFWGEKSSNSTAPIINALYTNNGLLLQTASETGSEFTIFDSALTPSSKRVVNDQCDVITTVSLNQTKGVLCTQYHPTDSDIYLYEIK